MEKASRRARHIILFRLWPGPDRGRLGGLGRFAGASALWHGRFRLGRSRYRFDRRRIGRRGHQELGRSCGSRQIRVATALQGEIISATGRCGDWLTLDQNPRRDGIAMRSTVAATTEQFFGTAGRYGQGNTGPATGRAAGLPSGTTGAIGPEGNATGMARLFMCRRISRST